MKGPRTTPTTPNQKELQNPNSSPKKVIASVLGVLQKSFSFRVVRVVRGQPIPVSRLIRVIRLLKSVVPFSFLGSVLWLPERQAHAHLPRTRVARRSILLSVMSTEAHASAVSSFQLHCLPRPHDRSSAGLVWPGWRELVGLRWVWILCWVIGVLKPLALGAANPGGYHVHWAVSGGGLADDQATALAVDGLGQLHVAGYFSGAASFSVNQFTNARLFEAFLALYDRNGDLLWVRSAGGLSQDAALGVAAEPDGQSWITGYFQSVASFGAQTLTNVAGNDAFLARYDPDGSCLWARGLSGPGDDRGYAVAVDTAGNGYFTGHFQSGASIDGASLTNRGGVDLFLAKFSPVGELLWVRVAGGPGVDVGYGLAIDPSGDVLICGYHGAQAHFGETTEEVRGNVDLFVAKYSSAGDLKWVRSAGGEDQDYANALSVDSEGGIYLTGTVRGDATFGALVAAGVGNRTYLARYDSEGNFGWVRTFGGSDARGLAAQGGHVFVAGQFLGTASFETNQVVSAGNFDAFLARYGSDGSLGWVRRLGGTGTDVGLALAAGPLDSCYLAGRFGAKVELDRINLTSGGGTDAFAALVSAAPLMILQPLGLTVSPGSEAQLTAESVGAEPLHFQWFFNETVPVPDATNAILRLLDVAPAQSGLYSLMVTNAFGSATSSPAYLNVFGLPLPKVRVGGLLTTGIDLTNAASAEVSLEVNLPGASLFYSLDGSIPNQGSFRYTGPFLVTTSAVVRAIAYDRSLTSSQSDPVPIRFHLSPPRFSIDGVAGTDFTFSNVTSVSVMLSSGLVGASLSYTLDGSVPGTNASVYTSPIVLTQTTTLRASATLPGYTTGVSDPVLVRIFRSYPLVLAPVRDGVVTVRPSGGIYPLGTVVQMTAQPARGWSFLRWSGDAEGTNPVILVTMDRAREVEALFGTVLTTTNLGLGSIQLEPASPAYARGEVVRATAVPGPGQFFALWGGIANGETNPLTFTINGPVPTLSALFSPLADNTYSLTVIPQGQGEVRWTPQQSSFEAGTEVRVEAFPSSGSRFRGWSGDRNSTELPLILQMTSNVVLTAQFVEFALKSFSVLQETGLAFRAIAPTGQVVQVQVSSNLVDWTAWRSITNRASEVEVQDRVGEDPVRFYRLLWE
jgi:hypothetical protein